MIRSDEKEVSWKAGALAIAVHLILLGALLISFNWKAAHAVLNVAEVELWDSVPNAKATKTAPPERVVKEAPPPEPVVKEEPKTVVAEEPQPETAKEPEVDIALENKLKALEQKKAEEKLKKNKLAELQAEALKDEVHESDKSIKDKQLKKLQQEALAEESAANDQQALSAKAAANAGIVDEFKNKIQAKIRSNVNKTLCGDGDPELKFEIGLLPTGELSANPKLIKSSGSPACDEAVERAIMASEPLPLPNDASLFSQFRNLTLKFRPND